MKNIIVPASLILLTVLGCSKGSSRESNAPEQYIIEIPSHIKPGFQLPIVSVPVFPDKEFNIMEYGAKGNGEYLNTEAIGDAIDACHAAGGGKVVIPAGKWLTGPIHFKSNVNLHLEKGAEVMFSENKEDYLPVVLIQRGGYFCYNYSPPVYAKDSENIAITGEGILNGQGQHWWPWKKNQPGMVRLFEMGKNNVPIEERIFGTVEGGVRPPFIQFIQSRNILIEGITIKDGPSWNLHPVFCENIIIRGITIEAHGPNNDGIDLDGCKNVLVENSIVDVGDDNFALKSGRDEEARRMGRPTENVVIRDCLAKAGHGGFVIGSEMSAGVRNVLVYNCRFEGTSRGIRMKSRLGRGGVVENIHIQDIEMREIQNEAIVINLRYDGEPIERAMNYTELSSSFPPLFKNIKMENISCDNAGQAVKLVGLGADNIREIHLKDISISAEEGIYAENTKHIRMEEIHLDIEKNPLIKIHDSMDFSIYGFRHDREMVLLLDLSGENSKNIALTDLDIRVEERFQLKDGLTEATVTLQDKQSL